jgi:hypothetical protein
MKVKGLLVGAALLALLGGCATYDDGYAYGYYGDGRYYGYRNDGYYRYNDGWRRWDGDRYYYRRGPDISWGFNYYNDR